ncbi:coiled-coil domain-containing protein 84 isoform X4 [Neoarius graeffei]|uniref:coiled-coil domain-containing protein 84 isoform X4 n=1 Tax=Neoarius graeffei TaxID=443677 RepID=UPI00298D3C34|nr:coiled-coil domain-containing protein 84 isoform X4 [Neoarius graeffei]
MGAFYCAVCRQTDFSGKGHIYGKSHQSKLKVVLVKFLDKVKEARRTLKCPQVKKFDGSEHEARFWCYCCEMEVRKHVTDGKVAVLYGGLLEHMSTQEHRKNTNAFWWKNKADHKHKEKFIITEQEADRFKEEIAKALERYEEKEDTLIKEQAALIRSQEQHRLEVLQALIEVCVPGMKQHLIQSCSSLRNRSSRSSSRRPARVQSRRDVLTVDCASRKTQAIMSPSCRISGTIQDKASLSLAIRTALPVETFTQGQCLHGCWRMQKTSGRVTRRTSVHRFRIFLNTKSSRNSRSSQPTV